MPTGTLKLQVTAGDGTIPEGGVSFAIKDKQGSVLYTGLTNENGESDVFTLETAPAELTMEPNPDLHPYANYDVWVAKPGFTSVNFIDAHVFDGIETILPINLEPALPGEDEEKTIVDPPPLAALPTPPQLQAGPPDIPEGSEGPGVRGQGLGNKDVGRSAFIPPPHELETVKNEELGVRSEERRMYHGASSRCDKHRKDGLTPSFPSTIPNSSLLIPNSSVTPHVLASVVAPNYITVHLGTPGNTAAQNVRVRFIDYVKNTTSHEIYPTWPVNSIIANVHCIVTFALNRIYTEWYRARGFAYDITNSTTVDQYYNHGGQIFQNISQIVDSIFNIYAKREGFKNPYFTEYCNGTTSTCKGLSQWGTVTLANRGFTPLQILHNYYPNDLKLNNAPSADVAESFPGTALALGSSGASVRRLQLWLNRIRANFPLIPPINNPNGYFGADTQEAVRVFQRSFNLVQDGIVGRSTWNKISQVFTAVTKLAELGGEGERIGLSPTPPTSTISQGSRGHDVIQAQFLLDYIAQFYPEIPAPLMDNIFGASTADAVRAFQRRFGLTVDGVVGPNTWRRLYEVFRNVAGQVPPGTGTPPPPPPPPGPNPPYPGIPLRQGSRGEDVRTLQAMLNKARVKYPSIPLLAVDGAFGPMTDSAVRAFQRAAGLTVDGIVGPITWNALAAIV
ncbi:MAG: peptidoglycan-binding protein [Firmicutes bacterium]|nr:peptidoglycan-binding protein [Bacillota bacterium]